LYSTQILILIVVPDFVIYFFKTDLNKINNNLN